LEQNSQLTIGFIGGSITDARPRHNWPEAVTAWFVETFPNASITVENAAIGATGSELAVFRAERDLINRGCDIVFVEFAVNDKDEVPDKRMRTREGLIRKLLEDQNRDLVLTYTYSQDMYTPMLEGRTPDTIADFERLAEHYGISSVWMGLYAMEEVKKGRMRWEEWLPDGLHPTSRGSLSYAHSVIAYLGAERNRYDAEAERERDDAETERKRDGTQTVGPSTLPEPLHPLHWGNAYRLPLSSLVTEGPWVLKRWPHYAWIDQVLETAAIGAKLRFAFEGRGLSLGFDFGKTSAEFRYRLDEGDWVTVRRERPAWVGDDGWYRVSFLGDDWPPGSHLLELEVTHGNSPDCRGTNFRLAHVGVIR
jgi:hypothetical protein